MLGYRYGDERRKELCGQIVSGYVGVVKEPEKIDGFLGALVGEESRFILG